MDIPFFSSHELWRSLCTENIGFYTHRTSGQIPNVPGIYAWFLPIDIKGPLDAEIKRNKSFFVYDPVSRSTFNRTVMDEVQWKKVKTSIEFTTAYRRQQKIERKWDTIKERLPGEEFKALRQVITLASIFSSPLYIGLTKSLSTRYEQHVEGSDRNTFYKRFSDYVEEHQLKVSIRDLIFAGIPVNFFPESSVSDISDEDLIFVVEYILKNIVGPVFGEV